MPNSIATYLSDETNSNAALIFSRVVFLPVINSAAFPVIVGSVASEPCAIRRNHEANSSQDCNELIPNQTATSRCGGSRGNGSNAGNFDSCHVKTLECSV